MNSPLIVDAAKHVAPYMWRGGSPLDYVVSVGKSGTLQTIHKASGTSIQSVMPLLRQGAEAASNLVPVLAAVNLGVGVANLGVSVYSAYQITQVRKSVDGVKADVQGVRLDVGQLRGFVEGAFHDVKDLLRHQEIALGILNSQAASANEKLDALRAEMAGGFQDLHAALLDQEAQRARSELLERLSVLVQNFGALSDIVGQGLIPDSGSTRAVIESATGLIGWLDAKMARFVVGDPTRLPLLSVKRAALRMRADARQFETGGKGVARREEVDLARQIADDALAACNDCTLYDLGVKRDALLAEYVMLRRSLVVEPYLALPEDGTAFASWDPDVIVWDDQLSGVRRLVAGVSDAPDAIGEVAVRTLEDREWLCAYSGVPIEDYPSVSRERVAVREILRSIGVQYSEDVRVAQEVFDELLRLSQHSATGAIATHIAQELKVSEGPRVRRGVPT
jgi:hypothetical protein